MQISIEQIVPFPNEGEMKCFVCFLDEKEDGDLFRRAVVTVFIPYSDNMTISELITKATEQAKIMCGDVNASAVPE